MLRLVAVGACALVMSGPATAQTTKAQRATLDDVAAAMVAEEKCPGLRFNQAAAATMIAGGRMNAAEPNIKELLGVVCSRSASCGIRTTTHGPVKRPLQTSFCWDDDKARALAQPTTRLKP